VFASELPVEVGQVLVAHLHMNLGYGEIGAASRRHDIRRHAIAPNARVSLA
jgi:hypothetical protein